jgi:probable FeS assembly SUF system protein SufT
MRTQPPFLPFPPSEIMRGHDNEPFVIAREVQAVMVPAGTVVQLHPGQAGYITQALGGSFTLYIEGNLLRLAGVDADAIGKDVNLPPQLPPNATEADVRELAWQQMRTCFDPEIPINIVDLGLIYECEVKPNDDGTRHVEIRMTLTAPGCGMGDILVHDVKEKIEQIPTVREAAVELVFDPPWNQSMMSAAAQLQTGMM